MEKQKHSNIAVALAFVGMMFFALGFGLGINSFLIPVLEGQVVDSKYAYLILAATFLPFIIFGYPASLTIRKIGYKRTMALSFAMYAVAFALYIPAAEQHSFLLFLLASFISGTANTFLQASVNPYVTILGPLESAAKRISIMGICNKLAWAIAPVFLALVIGKSDLKTITMGDLTYPFIIIIGIFVLLGIVSLLAPLPEVKAKGEDAAEADDCPYAKNKTSIWQFPHLLLGALALFLYVGVETVALSSLVDYATQLGLDNAGNFGWISSIGMVIGYICGIILIPKYLSQARALYICSVLAIAGSLAVVLLPGQYSIWAISLIALGCSLMWPALWPLAMHDLGRFTKTGASMLTMAIAGGAVVPTIFGYLKAVNPERLADLTPEAAQQLTAATMQNAYWICLPCFLFILYYALSGYKIRTK